MAWYKCGTADRPYRRRLLLDISGFVRPSAYFMFCIACGVLFAIVIFRFSFPLLGLFCPSSVLLSIPVFRSSFHSPFRSFNTKPPLGDGGALRSNSNITCGIYNFDIDHLWFSTKVRICSKMLLGSPWTVQGWSKDPKGFSYAFGKTAIRTIDRKRADDKIESFK